MSPRPMLTQSAQAKSVARFTAIRGGYNRVASREHRIQSKESGLQQGGSGLNVDAGAEIAQIDRVMHVDGVPRIIVRNSILHSAAPGLHKVALGNRSLYDTLNRQYGLVFEGAERWIEATSAGKDEAQLLEIPEQTPLLSIESRALAPGGTFVEYFHALYRTDQARLHFVVRS